MGETHPTTYSVYFKRCVLFLFLTIHRSHMEKKQVGCCYEMRRRTCVLRALNSSKYAAYFPTPHRSHMEKCSSAISTVPKARENSAEWAKRTRRRTPCTSSGAFRPLCAFSRVLYISDYGDYYSQYRSCDYFDRSVP